jgi:ProP effector
VNARKRHEQAARSHAIIGALCELWPACFALYERRRKPLKVGIDRDVIAACATAIASGSISRNDLKYALGFYVRNIGYLRACRAGAARIGLDGAECGIVSTEEAAHAASLIFAQAKPIPVTPKAQTKKAPSPLGRDERAFEYEGSAAHDKYSPRSRRTSPSSPSP